MTLLLDPALLEEERREWKGLVVILGQRGVYSGQLLESPDWRNRAVLLRSVKVCSAARTLQACEPQSRLNWNLPYALMN
jgi:hypothetical protein